MHLAAPLGRGFSVVTTASRTIGRAADLVERRAASHMELHPHRGAGGVRCGRGGYYRTSRLGGVHARGTRKWRARACVESNIPENTFAKVTGAPLSTDHAFAAYIWLAKEESHVFTFETLGLHRASVVRRARARLWGPTRDDG